MQDFGGLVTGLLLPALAVWRLTHLVWAEEGPWRVVARMRELAKAKGVRSIDCFYCLSLWMAAPFAVLVAGSVGSGVVDWLAFSGAAILIERATAAAVEPDTPPPVAQWEELPDEAGD